MEITTTKESICRKLNEVYAIQEAQIASMRLLAESEIDLATTLQLNDQFQQALNTLTELAKQIAYYEHEYAIKVTRSDFKKTGVSP